jgi:hypothetical protein
LADITQQFTDLSIKLISLDPQNKDGFGTMTIVSDEGPSSFKWTYTKTSSEQPHLDMNVFKSENPFDNVVTTVTRSFTEGDSQFVENIISGQPQEFETNFSLDTMVSKTVTVTKRVIKQTITTSSSTIEEISDPEIDTKVTVIREFIQNEQS